MTEIPLEQSGQNSVNLRRWQIAVAVLALVALTLLIINVVLRVRVDAATTSEAVAVATASGTSKGQRCADHPLRAAVDPVVDLQ